MALSGTAALLASLAPALVLSGLLASACTQEGDARCVPVVTDCAPLYEPTFTQIHARTLVPTCALGGGACHGPTGGQGGLRLQDEDEAYRTLKASGKIGTVACSELYARLASSDGNFRMPPGRSLPSAEQCVIAKWIAAGAPR